MLAELERRAAGETPPNAARAVSQKIEVVNRTTETYRAAREIAGLDGPRNRQERRTAQALQSAAPAPPAPPAPRKRDAYMAELERQGRREKRWREKHAQRMAERCLAPDGEPWTRIGFEQRTWVMVREILSDASGRAARMWCQHYRRVPTCKAAIGALLQAALVPTDEGCVRGWQHTRTRGIVALGLAMLATSQHTRRKGRYRRLFRGVTVNSLLALLECPFSGERLHRNTLVGRAFVGATLRSGLGYVRALHAAGFFHRPQQLPPAEVDPCERWTVERVNKQTGEVERAEYASSRYWICTAEPDDGHLSDAARARVRELEDLRSLLEGPVFVRRRRLVNAALRALDESPAPS